MKWARFSPTDSEGRSNNSAMHTFDIGPIEVNQKMAIFGYEMFQVGFKPRKEFGFETHIFFGGGGVETQ